MILTHYCVWVILIDMDISHTSEYTEWWFSHILDEFWKEIWFHDRDDQFITIALSSVQFSIKKSSIIPPNY